MTDCKLSRRAIVVGAGLAGLTAAYRLQQFGWQVVVYEACDYPGGRAASLEKDGYLIDTGATGVGDVYEEYMGLIQELGLSDKVEYASAISATVRDGRLFEVDGNRPIVSGALSKLFSWPSKWKMLRLFRDLNAMGDKMNFQDLSVGHEYDDESAEQYAHRRLNQELLDYLVDPILRALVVARASEVSRLELMNAINGLFSTRLLGTRGGMRLLPTTLARQLDSLHLQHSVQSVVRNGEQVSVSGTDNNGQAFNDRADACVIATTLPEAAEMDSAGAGMLNILGRDLHYIPGICLHLGYRVTTKTPAIMALVSSKEHPRFTLVWLDHNKVSDRAPAGHSLLYLYYDDAVAEDAATRSDEQLVAEGCEYVEQLFPELKGALDMQHVSRWPRAVPKPAPGIYKRMHQLRQKQDAAKSDRVQYAGDYLSCVGQNTAIVYGEKAAQTINNHVV